MAGSSASVKAPATLIANVVHGNASVSVGKASVSAHRSSAPSAPPAATAASSRGAGSSRLKAGASRHGALGSRHGRIVPRERRLAALLPDELAEEPALEALLLGGPGERQQPLLAAERVGQVEQLHEAADGRGRVPRHRDVQVGGGRTGGERPLDRVGADALAQVALEGAEEVGEALGQRVVALVREREQAHLAPQLAVVALELDERPQRDAEDLDAHLVGGRGGVHLHGRAGDGARHGGVAGVRGGCEPDGLAVLVEVDAPRVRAAGHDAEPAAEGEQQVVLAGGVHGRHDRGLGRAVAHLDARVLAGAAHPHAQRRLGVEQRVGDELGDAELGALDEVLATDVQAGVDDPAACVLDAAGSRAQGQGGPAQWHGRNFLTRVLPSTARVPRRFVGKTWWRRRIPPDQTGLTGVLAGVTNRTPPIAGSLRGNGTMGPQERVLWTRSTNGSERSVMAAVQPTPSSPSTGTPSGSEADQRHRVVVIGSGFGGLFGTKALRRSDVDVTMIAKTTHHLLQQLLYHLPTGILSQGEIAPPTREILSSQRNAQVLLGEVTAIDLDAHTVTSQVLGRESVTPYDSLFVAAGAGQSYFGNDHFAEFAPGMKSIDDALELRGRIFGAFELAELAHDQAEIDRLMTFVVVGAGPTGVEMAGQIAELAHRTLRKDFRHIDPTTARIILLDAAPTVLPSFGSKLGGKARRQLNDIGVEVQLGAMVTNVDENGIEVKDADGQVRRINAATKIWAAGVQASSLGKQLAEQSGAETDRAGRVHVLPDLTLPGHPEVHVVGDMINLDKRPGVAQVASQGARYSAYQI